MKIKNGQKLSILLYLILSGLILAGALFLGSRYFDRKVSQPIENVPEETMTNTAETESEPVLAVIASKIEEVAESIQPETERTETAFSETVVDETSESVDKEQKSEPEEVSENPVDSLMMLFESEAPLRWKKVDSVNENGELQSEFVKVYPKLAYMYKDLETGVTVAYNEDEILYSASLIKALYIYTALEEIDNFEQSRQEIAEAEVSSSTIPYSAEEAKYNLDELWTFDPDTMMEEGSGEIMKMPAGVQMTWRELFEYALLYSDNIAFAQIRERFGYDFFYRKVAELGVQGVSTGFMNLSARDCAIFLERLYAYFETESDNAVMMRDCMTKSKHLEMIAANYPTGTVAHKYGWDLGAFHDMAIVYDEHPYVLVIMTDYEDGGEEPIAFIADVVARTKTVHTALHPKTEEERSTSEESAVR